MDAVIIGNFLQEKRKEKRLTQEQLAEKLNISYKTISKWETGVNLPNITLLEQIFKILDITFDEFITGSSKPKKR